MIRLSYFIAICLTVTGVTTACRGGSAADANGDIVLAGTEPSLAKAIAGDTTLAAAQRALQAGHPWRATRILSPVLRDPARRTPAAVLLAARAAAGWEGWSEVDRLLRGQPWLATSFAGAGYELLARSALEHGADTVAAANFADSALRLTRDVHDRATRTVLLARALDRLNQRDSARKTYERASQSLRDISDWLALRAAGVTDDSSVRARLFAAVRSPAARERIEWTDALARERGGDIAGAAARYERLGAMASAFRLRLGPTTDSVTRQAVRDTVIQFLRTKGGTAEARQAVDVLDKAFPSLSPAEELIVARSANVSGPVARAIAGYAKGLATPEATSKDRLDYGELLIRAGKYRDAPAVLEQVRAPSNLAAEAAYQRGRALLLGGDGGGARTALRAVAETYHGDTTGAASALYLLGDLATDDGRDDEAQGYFRSLYRSYPTSSRADDALFRTALIDFIHGDHRQAAMQFDSLVARYPRSSEATAGRYWSGRAWSEAGDRTRATTAWRDVIAREPLSYYAGESARQLKTGPWSPPGGDTGDHFPRVPAVDSAMRRITELEQLGMDTEARFEYDALEAAATTPDRLLATAAALRDHGQTSRSIRLAWKIIDGGTRDARAYRLAYPVIDQDELTRQARARSIDPTLVAAIIRQESSFNPRAVSIAGARGLMQVMPSVGQQIARSLGYPIWDAGLLFDPDANLELGVSHLASSIKQYNDNISRVLAAYNAGGSRVTRWAAKAGTDDPEIFTERISFTETRDYVRIVQRNAELYKALYHW